MKKLTAKDIIEIKGKRKLTMTTAYDFYTAKAAEVAGIDILVTSGVLVENLLKGNKLTKSDTLEEGLIALEGVRKGAPNNFIVAGLPYGYPHIDIEEALSCAISYMKNGADAVHVSGLGVHTIKMIVRERIPCFGHVGLLPNYATWIGGIRSVGKSAVEAMGVYKDALLLQDIGVIALEMECMPAKIAEEIAKRLRIPVIGIGSGPSCDGQYLFSCDILGSHDEHYPRHSKKYLNIYNDTINAFSQFKADVDNGSFPGEKNNIEINSSEFIKFKKDLEELR